MATTAPGWRWQAFHTHKRGNAPEEYEDAFAGDPARGRFAIADGASESSFVAAWAKLLVEGFVAATGRPWRELGWLGPQEQSWRQEVDGLSLPWFAEEKREQGAFSTLLGLAFLKPKGERPPACWRALAVGDSCLFRLRGGQVSYSFPLKRAADFGNLPHLLGSRGRPTHLPLSAIRRAHGRCKPGDRFVMATDALAEWILRRTEANYTLSDDIECLLADSDPRGAFASWVEERRDQHGLRNDDVTLLIIDPS
jgi:hypothetical protein